MKDRRTLVMLALTVAVVAVGALYLFTPDDRADGTAVRTFGGIGAAVVLLLLVVLASGSSRPKPDVRDEEERQDG
ncbi:MAG: hypothetical protein ACXW27_15635 [Allosphingosinicella sp.]